MLLLLDTIMEIRRPMLPPPGGEEALGGTCRVRRRRRRPRRELALLLPALLPACAALAAASCSGGRNLVIEGTSHEGPIEVIAVYPYQFRWPEPPWRSYQHGRTLVDAALGGGRHLVLGPQEFRVLRAEVDPVLAGSMLQEPLRELGVPLERAVVLRGRAEERRIASSAMAVDAAGELLSGRPLVQRTIITHLEIVHVSSGRTLLQGSTSIEIDPFDELPDWDPLAPLREANGRLAEALLARLPAAPVRPPALGGELVPNPVQAIAFQPGENNRSGLEVLDDLPDLEQAVERDRVIRFFDEDPCVHFARRLERAGAGLVVRDRPSAGLRRWGLEERDIVLSCGGRTLTGPETLQRLLHLGGEEGARCEVLRGGGVVTAVLRPR